MGVLRVSGRCPSTRRRLFASCLEKKNLVCYILPLAATFAHVKKDDVRYGCDRIVLEELPERRH